MTPISFVDLDDDRALALVQSKSSGYKIVESIIQGDSYEDLEFAYDENDPLRLNPNELFLLLQSARHEFDAFKTCNIPGLQGELAPGYWLPFQNMTNKFLIQAARTLLHSEFVKEITPSKSIFDPPFETSPDGILVGKNAFIRSEGENLWLSDLSLSGAAEFSLIELWAIFFQLLGSSHNDSIPLPDELKEKLPGLAKVVLAAPEIKEVDISDISEKVSILRQELTNLELRLSHVKRLLSKM
ncbi:MAG TPA: hypothetical protein PKA63_03310 [Oligoflexia bacterium]|nr:hypothetical protein [Oligoflexia bacterium]HMP47683.1 hypothetical protein [Oligoflexia bacterium]